MQGGLAAAMRATILLQLVSCALQQIHIVGSCAAADRSACIMALNSASCVPAFACICAMATLVLHVCLCCRDADVDCAWCFCDMLSARTLVSLSLSTAMMLIQMSKQDCPIVHCMGIALTPFLLTLMQRLGLCRLAYVSIE